jgi:hypothetical protein
MGRHAGIVIAVVLAGGGAARAHEPYEITVNARIRDAGLALQVLLADSTAALVCGTGSTNRRRDAGVGESTAVPDAAQRALLQACGRNLFRITAGGGVPLKPLRVEARITVENDVDLEISYSRPPSGRMRFDAIFLDRLRDPTYGANVTVTGPGIFLGQSVLRATSRALVVEVPAGPGTAVSR